MKKITLLAAVIIAASFASCKKDYTCECTTSGNGSSITTTSTVNGKKKDVKTACENGSSTFGSVTTVCSIK